MGDFFKQITRVFTPHAFKVEPEAIDPAATGGVTLTQNIVDALTGASGADGSNVFATMNDITPSGPAVFNCTSDGVTGALVSFGCNFFERFGYNTPSTSKIGTGLFRVDASGSETPFGQAFAIATPRGADPIHPNVFVADSTRIDIEFIDASSLPVDPLDFTVTVFIWF